MLETQWSIDRGEFSHQWLANNYLNQLRYWVSEMTSNSSEDDPDFQEKFVKKTLRQWEHRSKQAADIIEHAIEHLSPRRLFDDHPLCQIPAHIRDPMSEACHQRWLQRTAEIRGRAEEAKRQVDSAYNRLMTCLSQCSFPLTSASAKRCGPLAIKFEAACNELKTALEILPKCAYW